MANLDKVEAIFHAAQELAEEKRASFLDRACVGDASLRADVEGLLRAGAKAESFLESAVESAAETMDTGPLTGPQVVASRGDSNTDIAIVTEQPGTKIGPYKLLQKIGEGGFGSVFMAEQQEPVRRMVALKIIKLGMDTRQVVARFEQERQALAWMSHPNIAKVFDAGATETGRPFFVMELCTGDAITDYCDKHNLSIKDRLELFVQVCQAVQHAHQKGLIHRDIKPSNVLVSTQDGKPSAKVIDFGIAKATSAKLTEKTLFTAHKQLIGTPEYMSPEQAEGSLDIDTRTDVYALGVMLYELLTGATPFDPKTLRSAAYAEIQRIIREVDPPNPSTRLQQNSETIANIAARRQTEPRRLGTIVRGELDWIVMKSLDKNRQRRYESAVGLGRDIERYLGGEPVVAAPPGATYKLRKFVRRHRGPVAASAAVAAALLIGLIAFAWQAKVARQQRDRAVVAEATAREQRDRAVTAEAETAKRAKDLKQVSEFQAKMLSEIDATDAGVKLMANIRSKFAADLTKTGVPDSERAARTEVFERELLHVNATDTASELIDDTILKPAIHAVDSQFKEQPVVDASLRNSLAEVYSTLGLLDSAETLQAEALATRRRVLGDANPDTLVSLNNMGVLLQDEGKFAEAEKCFRESLEGNTRALGAEHIQTIKAMRELGNLYCNQAKFAASEPLLISAVEKSRRVLGDDARDTLIAINSLGYLYATQGQPGKAEPLWREAYDRGRRALGEEDSDVLVWVSNLGSLIQIQGRAKEAEPYFREALEKYRRVRGEEHPLTIQAIQVLGANLRRQGKLADAESFSRDALEKSRRTFGAQDARTLGCQLTLGSALMEQDKFDEADAYLRQTWDARKQLFGADNPETLDAQGVYATLLSRAKKYDQSEALNRDALERATRVLGAEHPTTLIFMLSLSNALIQDGKGSEAAPLAKKIFEARKRISGPEHPETLVAENSYARALQLQGKLDEAEPLFVEALKTFRKVLGNDHRNTLYAISNLARVLRDEGKFSEAEPLYREVIAGLERTRGKDYPELVDYHLDLAKTLTGLNRFQDAEKELLEVDGALSAAPHASTRQRRASLDATVALYEAWEKSDPGKGYAKKAEEWSTKRAAWQATTRPS